MFSFHKPKVYRSSTGCCICKAKSSSSRFTDSKKYEEDFVECFQLPEKRCGEVCNACVLLVKRWKKLPEGNGRNWRHVVDARAKTFSKVKSRVSIRATPKRKSADDDQFDQLLRKKKPRKLEVRNSCDDLRGEEGSEESPDGSRSPSPSLDADDSLPVKSKRLPRVPHISGFIDLKVWKMEKICCGTIFVGPGDSIIVDPRLVVPCKRRASGVKCSSPLPPPVIKAPAASPASSSTTASKTYSSSDNSSDSGYDESSNQSSESTLPRPLAVAN